MPLSLGAGARVAWPLLVASLVLLPGQASADEFDEFDALDSPGPEAPATTAQQTAAAQPAAKQAASFALGVGGIVATRSLSLQGSQQQLTHEPSAYLGGRVELALYAFDLEALGATVGLVGQGAYAGAKNAQAAPELGREPITELMFGHAALAVARPFSPDAHLEVCLGLQATSVLVERNLDYTGHRYVSGLIGATLRGALLDRRLLATLELALLPDLSTNESNRVEAEAASFGLRAGGQLGWSFAPSDTLRMSKAGVSLGYTFQRFRAQYGASSRHGADATSEDVTHVLGLTLHYAR